MVEDVYITVVSDCIECGCGATRVIKTTNNESYKSYLLCDYCADELVGHLEEVE